MVKVYFKNKSIVLPGELILELQKGEKVEVMGNYYTENEKVYAKSVSLFEIKGENKFKITPLAGSTYIPKVGDFIIGIVKEVGFSGWLIDINSPYSANLPLREAVNEFVDVITQDLSKYYDYGDIIACKVINVPKSRLVQVSVKGENLGKLQGGRIIEISPHKVPRVIGKNASMVQTIKQITGVKILVGQNGRIWIKHKLPEVERLVARAILRIEKESHLPGLTEKIKNMLEEGIKEIQNEV